MNARTIWIYWLLTAVLIGTSLLWWPPALFLAMAVTALHAAHFFLHSPHLTAFPMQVRLGFLGLLILGQAPFLGWVHWVQLAGTTALLSVDYCPLARILSLMPWNRSRALSWKVFARAFFTPPVEGSIVDVMSKE